MSEEREVRKTIKWHPTGKGDLWFDCIKVEHLPVCVGVGGSQLLLYCKDCKKVWRVARAGRLEVLEEKYIEEQQESVWKNRLLKLIAENKEKGEKDVLVQ